MLDTKDLQEGVLQRFLRYVQVETTADPTSSTVPSSKGQLVLGRMLQEELQALGLQAEQDENGYVIARLASNVQEAVPTLCFCAHLDTSPDAPGAHVKPQVHPPYEGGDLVLPGEPGWVLGTSNDPDLLRQLGHTLVTSDGTTLLGADDKAGVAEIMEAVRQWVLHPEWPHGPLIFLFTVDEEIGRGVDHLDLASLGADWAYTLDGEERGDIEDETFSADSLTLTIHGVSAHPGFAKGRLVNALKIAGCILAEAANDLAAPEHTEDRQGFVHPVSISGQAERCQIQWILRDFQSSALDELEAKIQGWTARVISRFPGSRYEIQRVEQYRNMKDTLDRFPFLVDYAMAAMQDGGLTPKRRWIRGGTDGSRLTAMGLPCPNLFAGGHRFHSRLEWVSAEDMASAVHTILHLARRFALHPPPFNPDLQKTK
ncbi:MAG: peptidase T [Bacteroidia bacterium]|nr:peptidase T [Bacteroidia bacterium]